MARFIAVPSFAIFKDGTWAEPEQWWLDGPCIYQSDIIGINGLAIKVTVPKDFKTDLSSIPHLFRLFLPKNGKDRAAAVVHDWLCQQTKVSRKITDQIFFEAMTVTKVSRWRQYILYTGARIGALNK